MRLVTRVWASPPDRYVGNARIFEGFRACLLRLRNSDGSQADVPVSGTMTLQLRRGRDRRGTADLRSCCRNRVRLGGAVLGGWPIPVGSDELRPGRHDLRRHVRDRWGPGRPLLRSTGGQRRGPGKGSREWNHDRGVRRMRVASHVSSYHALPTHRQVCKGLSASIFLSTSIHSALFEARAASTAG